MKKDDEEWLVMNYFRESYPDFPGGKLIKSESPDFILKTGRKYKTGIELTCLCKDEIPLKERIVATLLFKDQKAQNYIKKHFKAVFLIIYSDYIDNTKAYNIHNKLLKWVFNSDFDRVFLFDLFERQITELLITKN